MSRDFPVPVSGEYPGFSRISEELGVLSKQLRRLHQEAIEARASGSDRQLEVICLEFAAAAFRVSSVRAFTQHGQLEDLELGESVHGGGDKAQHWPPTNQQSEQHSRYQLRSNIGLLQRALYNAVVNWDALPENIIWAAVYAIKLSTGPAVPPEVSQNFGGKLEWYIVPPAPSRYPGRNDTLHNEVASRRTLGVVSIEDTGVNHGPLPEKSVPTKAYRARHAHAAFPLRASVLEWMCQPQSGELEAAINTGNANLDLYAVNSPLAVLLPALVGMQNGSSVLAQNLTLLIEEVLVPFAETFMHAPGTIGSTARIGESVSQALPFGGKTDAGDIDHGRRTPREPRRGQTLLAVTSVCVLSQWCDYRRLSGIFGSESERGAAMRLLWFAARCLHCAPVHVIGRVTTAPLRILSSLMPSFLRRDGDLSLGGGQGNAQFAANDNPTGEGVFDPWPEPAALVGFDDARAVSAKVGFKRRCAQYYTVLSTIDSSHSRSRLKHMHLLHCASFSVVSNLLLYSNHSNVANVGQLNSEENASGADISSSFDLIHDYVFKLLDQVVAYGLERHRLLETASLSLNRGWQHSGFPVLPSERHGRQTQAATASMEAQLSSASPALAARSSWTSRLAAGFGFRGSIKRSHSSPSGVWSAHEAREDLIEATTMECFRILHIMLVRNCSDTNPRQGQGFRGDSNSVLPRAVRFATDDLYRLIQRTSSGLQPLTHLQLLRFLLVHGTRVGLDIQAALHGFFISVLRYFGSSEIVVDQTFCFLWDCCRRPYASLNIFSNATGQPAKIRSSQNHTSPSAWQQPPGSQFTTLQLYAPAIMKLFAQQPRNAHLRLMALLPQLVARGAASSAVLHLILDLPLIAAVLDVLDLRSFDNFVAEARQQRFNGQSTKRAPKDADASANGSANGAARAKASTGRSPVHRDIPAIEATAMCLLRDTIIDPVSGAVVSETFCGHAASADQKQRGISPTAAELEHRSWKHCTWGNSARLARRAARHGPTLASPAPAMSQHQGQGTQTEKADRVSSSRQGTTPKSASPPPHRHTVPPAHASSSSTPGDRPFPLLDARIRVFEQLQAAFPGTTRVYEVCALVPELLQLFFDHILDLCLAHQRGEGVDSNTRPTRTPDTGSFSANEAALGMNEDIFAAPEAALEAVLVCAARTPFIFGPPAYQAVVRRILRDRLLALFELQPSLLNTTHTLFGDICSKIFRRCQFRPQQFTPHDHNRVSASAFLTPPQKTTREDSGASKHRDTSGFKRAQSPMEPSLVTELNDVSAWTSRSLFESSTHGQRGQVPKSRPWVSPATPSSPRFRSPSVPTPALNVSTPALKRSSPKPSWFWNSLQTLLVPVIWIVGQYCRIFVSPLKSGADFEPENHEPANFCFLQLVNGINTCVAVIIAPQTSANFATSQNSGYASPDRAQHLLSRLTNAVPDLWSIETPYVTSVGTTAPSSASSAPSNASSAATAKVTPSGVHQQPATPVQHGRKPKQSPFSAHASPMGASAGPVQSPILSSTKGTPSTTHGKNSQRNNMGTDSNREQTAERDEEWLGFNTQLAAHALRVLLLSLCKLAVFHPHLRTLASKSFQNLLNIQRPLASPSVALGGTVPSQVLSHAQMMLEILRRPGMALGLFSDFGWSVPESRRPLPSGIHFADTPLPALVRLSPATSGLAQISSVCSLEGKRPMEAPSTDTNPHVDADPVPSTSEKSPAESDTPKSDASNEPLIEKSRTLGEGERGGLGRPGHQIHSGTDAAEDASAVRDSVVHSLIYRLLQHC